MCIRPLACERHWLNVEKNYIPINLPHAFKDEEGPAQLRTNHQLHCLEPAVLHTELNHSHVPPVPLAQREVPYSGSCNGLSLQSTLIPQKLCVGSFSLDSIFFRW